MAIDSHEHIMFPVKMQLDKMDKAGVDKTVLFCTAPGESFVQFLQMAGRGFLCKMPFDFVRQKRI